jgi:hypothetical protein
LAAALPIRWVGEQHSGTSISIDIDYHLKSYCLKCQADCTFLGTDLNFRVDCTHFRAKRVDTGALHHLGGARMTVSAMTVSQKRRFAGRYSTLTVDEIPAG